MFKLYIKEKNMSTPDYAQISVSIYSQMRYVKFTTNWIVIFIAHL